MINYSAPDLTQHPPRSGRVTLGGFVHLPRLLDKARAHLAGKAGAYDYNCGMDKNFFNFTGIDHEDFLAEVKKGRTDSEMNSWVKKKAKKGPSEIRAWSEWLSQRGPGGTDGHAWMSGVIKNIGKDREDVTTFFDLLDLDDYVSFGGKG
jgi:hypothetical protein